MTLAELEQCVHILLRHAASWGVGEVPGDRDYYWTVGSPDWLTVPDDPEVGIGSFADDEAELRKLLADPARAAATDLDRVAHLLKLVSERIAR